MTRVALALLVIVGVGLMQRRRRPVHQPDDIDWLAEYRRPNSVTYLYNARTGVITSYN